MTTAASDYLRAPQVVAEGDGYGLFYVATTISGTTGAWFQRVDSGGTVQPEVNGYHSYLPIPTIGGSFGFDELDRLVVRLVDERNSA